MAVKRVNKIPVSESTPLDTIEELQARLKSAEETNQYLVLATIELYEMLMPEEETA